jgi:hypothetical protein
MFSQKFYVVCLFFAATRMSMLYTNRQEVSMLKNTRQAPIIDNPATAQPHPSIDDVHIRGIYKHRNGNRYKVLTVACNTEDLSSNVIYEALYENKVSKVWCRKVEDFLAIITLEDGTQQPRFIYQGQAE